MDKCFLKQINNDSVNNNNIYFTKGQVNQKAIYAGNHTKQKRTKKQKRKNYAINI